MMGIHQQVLCENLCEKIFPKSANMCKIDKNVKTLYPVL